MSPWTITLSILDTDLLEWPSGSHRLSLPWDTSETQGCGSVTTTEPEPVNEAPPDRSENECDGWINWPQETS